MQLSDFGQAAQTQGMAHTQAFQMQMNAKMFSILTDKLYQNKEGAVIRELSANARDAHVAAGKADVPFMIKMPTWLDQNFTIRDYGTGIDPEEFYDIYTNLGHSTKDGENDSIGAYGLGSKTPFSMTDSYTIRNFFDGTVYLYTAYKDAGMPTVSLIGEQPTDLPNGLEISLNTDRSNIYAFNREVLKQLKYFDVKPIVINDDDQNEPAWEEMPDLSTGYSFQGGSGEIEIVMGGILYSARYYDINNEEVKSFLSGSSIVLQANLGDVDIPPSREGLELTPKTIDFILKKFSEIKASYSKDFIERLKNCKNLYQFWHTMNESKAKLLTAGAEYTWGDYTGTRTDLLRELGKVTLENTSNRRIDKHYKSYHRSAGATSFHDLCLFKMRLTRRLSVSGDDDRILLINDIQRGVGPIIKEYHSLLVSGDYIITDTTATAKDFSEKAEALKARIEDLGFSVKYLSEYISYVKPPKGARKVNKSLPSQMLTLNSSCKLDVLSMDTLPDSGYYYKVSGLQVVSASFNLIRFAMEVMGKKVYGLRSIASKQAESEGKLIEVSELLPEALRLAKAKVLNGRKNQQRIDAVSKPMRTIRAVPSGIQDEMPDHWTRISDYYYHYSKAHTGTYLATMLLGTNKVEPSTKKPYISLSILKDVKAFEVYENISYAALHGNYWATDSTRSQIATQLFNLLKEQK